MTFLHWFAARARGAFDSWIERGIGIVVVLAALFVWREWSELPSEITLSRWAFGLAIAFALFLVFALAFALVRGSAKGGTASEMERQLMLTAYYSRHIYDALETLQKILSETIPDVGVETFMEHGLLQPARDFLMQRAAEDVRLSILVPDGQDFLMACSAGHTLESKQRFRLPIDQSFSRAAYETGRIQWSGDLQNDLRFTRHPRAAPGREYNSIISLPIRSGDHTVGVLNVISTMTDAFEPADFLYVTLLGAIIDVVWSGAEGITDNGDDV